MKRIHGSVLGMLLLLVGASANADIRVATHPGTVCVALNDTAPDLYYNGNGTAYNDLSTSYSVVCSADKQYLNDNADDVLVDDSYWWAYVEDNNTSTDATCYLRSCNQNHSSCVNSVSRSTNGTGTQGLDTTGVTFAAGSYTQHVVLRCTLPAKNASGVRSGVHGFTTYEF